MSALDLDLLSEYLDGDQNEYGLDFAATHGFLCAIGGFLFCLNTSAGFVEQAKEDAGMFSILFDLR